jgi:hypothetical protein
MSEFITVRRQAFGGWRWVFEAEFKSDPTREGLNALGSEYPAT